MLWALQAIITTVEVVGSFIWLGKINPVKSGSKIRKAVFVLGVIFAAALTVIQRGIVMYSRWYLLLCIMLCTLISFILFRFQCSNFFAIALYYETVYCMDLLLTMLVGYFNNNPYVLTAQQYLLSGNRIAVLLAGRVMAVIILFLIYSIIDRPFIFLWEKWWYIIPVVEHLFLFECDRVMTPGEEIQVLLHFKISFTIFLLFIAFTVLFYIYVMRKTLSELIDVQKGLYKKSYENIISRRREKERLYHDLKNHILVMRGMLRSGELNQLEVYMDHLHHSFDSGQEYTGKQILDYLISEKASCARSLGISVFLECSSLPQSRTGQEDMDWTAVLGNLWDNATESCERCNGEKHIRFCMTMKNETIYIRMENTCPAITRRMGLITLKNTDGKHGIGMQSIRYVLARYNGTLDWKCEGDTFITNITMCM